MIKMYNIYKKNLSLRLPKRDKTTMKYDIFISYSRKDAAMADRICTALNNANISYFIDREGLSGGQQFIKEIVDRIDDSKIFLFLGSANSYDEKSYARREVTYAADERRCILPYIIDKTVVPSDIKLLLSGINFRNIYDHPVEPVLINDIRLMLGRVSSQTKAHIPTKHESITTWKLLVAVIAILFVGIMVHFVYVLPRMRNDDANIMQSLTPDSMIANGQKTITKQVGVVQTPVSENVKTTSQMRVEQDVLTIEPKPQIISQSSQTANTSTPIKELSASALVEKGVAAMRRFNHEQAIVWFLEASAKGSVDADYYLGELYYNGNGVDKSFVTAADYFERAANGGSADAQYMLGLMYRNGQGVTKNISIAQGWLSKAAAQGHAKAEQLINKL